MTLTFADAETRYQARRERADAGDGNRVMRRRTIPWRIGHPTFTYPAGDDLTRHSELGRRVFVMGDPAPATAVLRASQANARRVFAAGRFAVVKCANGTEVSQVAQWFGSGAYSVSDAETVWHWVEGAVQREWRDRSARLLMTPATTGRDLLVRSLESGEEWPVLSPDVQSIIRATAGQGRMETFPKAGASEILELHEYDARIAYAALMDDLPIGEPIPLAGRAARDHFHANPYGEGRYYVSWTAPVGWRHPGILPAHGDGATDWVWPLRSPAPSWCSAVELFTAHRAGWEIGWHGALVWSHRGSPLRRWRTRLLRILGASQTTDELSTDQRPMARAAIRAILLHAVGAMHGREHLSTETGAEPPDDALNVRLVSPGLFAWETLSEAEWPELCHPEWTATIWGRARARLVSSHRGLCGLLAVPAGELVAVRTDAIYTTAPTGWETHDDGAPGRYRHRVYRHDRPQPWPVNGTDVLRLRGAR